MQLYISTSLEVQSYWVIIDTGSNLKWTLCVLYYNFTYQMKSTLKPLQSSTYHNLRCTISFWSACDDNQLRSVKSSYGDGSVVEGSLALERFWFEVGTDGTIKLPTIAFGCVHKENSVEFENLVQPSLVGLRPGSLSLVSHNVFFINHKFAYSLPLHSKENNVIE
uniref:Peptidase A1 domain-containing protein n=1 Tax=Nymphaea colorata TaxID=210225 RepID=A0A5K0ZA29_9MAGN